MLKDKKEAMVLLCSIFIAIVIHVGPVFLDSWITERDIFRHKETFNQMMRDGSTKEETLKYLKILINNYESLEDTSILESTNVADLKKVTESLTPVHRTEFLKCSPMMNIAVLGPLLVPSTLFSIKRITRK